MGLLKHSLIVVVLPSVLFFGCATPTESKKQEAMEKQSSWKSEVRDLLKVYGHRNWIVVADAAYPQQSNPAIRTIAIDASHLQAVEFVSGLIEKAKHVDANIYVDEELAFVPEKHARGIESYRNGLNKVLSGKSTQALMHEEIIRKLDESAKLFNILILKTDLSIPYTSVFFQLECGYWDSGAEKELREAIPGD